MKDLNELEVSKAFDQFVSECGINFFSNGYLDKPMLSEEFSYWLDNEYIDNQLTDDQVDKYCYIGMYLHA